LILQAVSAVKQFQNICLEQHSETIQSVLSIAQHRKLLYICLHIFRSIFFKPLPENTFNLIAAMSCREAKRIFAIKHLQTLLWFSIAWIALTGIFAHENIL
jgi:hypothetical protein